MKTYYKPVLKIEWFDLSDVIVCSEDEEEGALWFKPEEEEM